MPVYVYKNLSTGETFEVQQRITEPAWTEHPETGDPVKRVVQPVGIAFKGSGFYVTDSRRGGSGSSSSGGATSKATSASSSADASSASGSSSAPAASGASSSGDD